MRSQCWVGESSRRQRVLLGLSGSFIYLVSLAASFTWSLWRSLSLAPIPGALLPSAWVFTCTLSRAVGVVEASRQSF